MLSKNEMSYLGQQEYPCHSASQNVTSSPALESPGPDANIWDPVFKRKWPSAKGYV